MTLVPISRSGSSLFSRHASMFDMLAENLGQNFSEDESVNFWADALLSDPLVQISSHVVKEAGFYGKTALLASNSILRTMTLPLTIPLSKRLKAKKIKLTDCPFPPARVSKIKGKGELVIRENSAYDQIMLGTKNFIYRVQLSKNPLLRGLYKLGNFIVTLPFRTRFNMESKSQLVMMSILLYFPSFDETKFLNWLEESFLPCLANFYLKGMTVSLKQVAEQAIVTERQMQVSEQFLAGYINRSRILSVYDVEILEYDFKQSKPVVTIRFSVDHTDHLVNRKGDTVSGGPDEIKKSTFLTLLTVVESGSKPVWKANEIHILQQSDRI